MQFLPTLLQLSLLRNAAETASDGFPTPSQAACAMKHGVNHALSRNEQDEKVKGPGLDGYSKWFQTFTMRGQAALNFRPERLLPKSLGEETSNDHNLNDPLRCLTPKTLSEATDYFRLLHDLVIPAKTRVPSRFSHHLIMTTYENSTSWSNSASLMNFELGGMLRFFGLKG